MALRSSSLTPSFDGTLDAITALHEIRRIQSRLLCELQTLLISAPSAIDLLWIGSFSVLPLITFQGKLLSELSHLEYDAS
jgi:hypothetical protein